jgi:hypothetical protein
MIAPAMPAGIEIMAGFGSNRIEHKIPLGTEIAAEFGLGDGGCSRIHGAPNYLATIREEIQP